MADRERMGKILEGLHGGEFEEIEEFEPNKKDSPFPTNPGGDHTKEEFDAALKKFVERCQELINDNAKKMGFTYADFNLRVRGGRKYIAIDKEEIYKDGKKGQITVYAFVEFPTGNVYKPATYKKPADHPRGNIFNLEATMKVMTPYGPPYMK